MCDHTVHPYAPDRHDALESSRQVDFLSPKGVA